MFPAGNKAHGTRVAAPEAAITIIGVFRSTKKKQSMKTLILKGIALFALPLFTGVLHAAAPVRGLVLFNEPPATYVIGVEFAALQKTSVVHATAIRPDGRKQEIPHAGVLAVVEYPVASPGSSAETASLALKNIQALRAKYPQLATKLDKASAAWTKALALSHQRGTAPASPKAGIILEVDGTKYTGVTLASCDGALVGIEHSDGVARIPVVRLKAEQITALNATTSAVRIDPSAITSKIKPGVSPEPTPHTAPVVASAAANALGVNRLQNAEEPNAPSSTVPPDPPTLGSVANETAEVTRRRALVAEMEAAWQKLESEHSNLRDQIHAPSTKPKDSVEIVRMNYRLAVLDDGRQQARLRHKRASRELEVAELEAFADEQKASVETYQVAATVPLETPDWETVVKKWTTQLAEQKKIAEAAENASSRAFETEGNSPTNSRLKAIRDAERKKLGIAETTLAKAKQRALEAVREENRVQMESVQAKQAAEQPAEEMRKFKDLPINKEGMITPPGVAGASPSYGETIEFLEARYQLKVGFGETSRRLIVRELHYGGQSVYAFDPKDINPELTVLTTRERFLGGSIQVELTCRHNQPKIEQFFVNQDPVKVSVYRVRVRDQIEAEKLAKALSHLVVILGAKREAF